MKPCRRDFLKISALGLGGALSANAFNVSIAKTVLSNESILSSTYCEICFWKCAGFVHKKEDGTLHKITGNPEDPLSKGRLCPRGLAGLDMYNDPDRLKTPLIRIENAGVQYYEEVSWPQALDYISSRMKKIMDEDGAESLALFNHGSGGKHFSRLFKALGSGNIAAPSFAQCRGPREIAFETTFGHSLGSPEPLDIENTECLVLLGSHLGENMHNTQVQELSELQRRGGKIITVDPRLSTVASTSDFWLPIKASTDIALLLAWMNVIIEEEGYDAAFIEQYCFGFEDLEMHVEDKTPEWAESITGIKASMIRESAKAMMHAAPAVIIHPGRHVTWYGDDTQRVRAIAILNAILGAYGRKGGMFFAQKTSVPSMPHPAYPVPKWTWKDNFPEEYLLSKSGISNAIIDSTLQENKTEHQVKGWFVVGSNLIQTIPDQEKTIQAIQDLELLVVVDTMPTEITGYADVVLPECTYLERFDDIRVSPYRNASLAVRTPAVKPAYLSKPAYWMTRKLAYRFGLQAHFNYKDYDDVIAYQLKKMGYSYSEVIEKGVVNLPLKENLYLEAGEERAFNTTTGLVELYSFALEDSGFDPLPEYTPHAEAPEGFVRLNYGRAPMHTFARTQNNRSLAALMNENPVWINPKLAESRGIKSKDEVYLETPSGKRSRFSAKVRITERVGEDSVYMTHGFGQADKRLTRAYGKGISDTEVMETVLKDPICGSTGMRGNFVKLIKKNKLFSL